MTAADEIKRAAKVRRAGAAAMSRQAYRLDSQLERICSGTEERLNNARAGVAVWQVSAKQAEFAHLVVEGYREGYFTPIAALVRTLFEDTTLLAWMSLPDAADQQTRRAIRVLRAFYSDARNKGIDLPPDAEHMLNVVKGAEARMPSLDGGPRAAARRA